jgi:hypothetical protein
MAEEEVHRLRVTYDVIYTGTKMSPSAAHNAAVEQAGYGQTLGLSDVKNVKVVYQPPEERVVYAHHHSSSEPGEHCRVKGGCLTQSADGFNQENAER